LDFETGTRKQGCGKQKSKAQSQEREIKMSSYVSNDEVVGLLK
jgi:hypothetical protein